MGTGDERDRQFFEGQLPVRRRHRRALLLPQRHDQPDQRACRVPPLWHRKLPLALVRICLRDGELQRQVPEGLVHSLRQLDWRVQSQFVGRG